MAASCPTPQGFFALLLLTSMIFSVPFPRCPPVALSLALLPLPGTFPLPEPPNPKVSPTIRACQSPVLQVPHEWSAPFEVSLTLPRRACPALFCSARHSDSWTAWSGAMQRWLMLVASSWTTSRIATSCVCSTHWLSMHIPSSYRYTETPESPSREGVHFRF